MSKEATPAQRRRMGIIAALGCVVCKAPAIIHHVKRFGGHRNHDAIIPLCPLHHMGGGAGVSIHDGRESWESVHGKELDYLDLINTIID
jgi:hypothetical protein